MELDIFVSRTIEPNTFYEIEHSFLNEHAIKIGSMNFKIIDMIQDVESDKIRIKLMRVY
jgi:hypothetical protein